MQALYPHRPQGPIAPVPVPRRAAEALLPARGKHNTRHALQDDGRATGCKLRCALRRGEQVRRPSGAVELQAAREVTASWAIRNSGGLPFLHFGFGHRYPCLLVAQLPATAQDPIDAVASPPTSSLGRVPSGWIGVFGASRSPRLLPVPRDSHGWQGSQFGGLGSSAAGSRRRSCVCASRQRKEPPRGPCRPARWAERAWQAYCGSGHSRHAVRLPDRKEGRDRPHRRLPLHPPGLLLALLSDPLISNQKFSSGSFAPPPGRTPPPSRPNPANMHRKCHPLAPRATRGLAEPRPQIVQ